MADELWARLETNGCLVSEDNPISSPFHDELHNDSANGAQVSKQVADQPEAEARAEKSALSIERGRIARPHQLLPALEDPSIMRASMEDLSRLANKPVDSLETFNTARHAHVEIVRRFEELQPEGEVRKAKESIPILLKALKEGKTVERGSDDKIILGNKPLTSEDRLRMHAAVCGDLSIMTQKVVSKFECASFMRTNLQFKDAETYAQRAKTSADELPIEMLREESRQLTADISLYDDPRTRNEMLRIASQLSGEKSGSADLLPIQTRKFLVAVYLGTELKREGESLVAEFGKTSGFNPDLAFEMAKETRAKTKELRGFDPLDEKQARQDPEVTSLFGGVCDIFGKPEKYNLYKLVDAQRIEKVQRELKNSTGTESVITDIGVVALTATILAASRNSRVHAGVEKVLGRALPGAEIHAARVSKIAGLSGAAISAPLARHYGYKALSGVDESWSETAVHVVGSLAAAELGGRISGAGSTLTGRAGKGIQHQQFNKHGITDLPPTQGYYTTGKIADLVRKETRLSDLVARQSSLGKPTDFDRWRDRLSKKIDEKWQGVNSSIQADSARFEKHR
jgi:hypothetical protein